MSADCPDCNGVLERIFGFIVRDPQAIADWRKKHVTKIETDFGTLGIVLDAAITQ